MKNDLISRQAAIDALHMHLMYRMGTDSNKKRLDEWINNLPSAQPERTGRWCFNTDGKLICSNCYEIPTNRILLNGNMVFDMTPIREKMKYCPNCGCRMLKEGEEHD